MSSDSFLLNEYQDQVFDDFTENINNNIVVAVLGLIGESGEVVDAVKKSIRDGFTHYNDIEEELGDVCWYVANIASLHGLKLETILVKNMLKTKERRKNVKNN